MQNVSATVESKVVRSFRVEQVAGMFDLPLEEKLTDTFTATLPQASDSWSIGLIVGPSGSGKSTLAKAAYGKFFHQLQPWPRDRAMIDGFGEQPIQQITKLLTAVGLGSARSWLRPYEVLSNGERFRCELARALLQAGETPERLIVIDEFTSVVDRNVARVASAAVHRAIQAKQIPVRLVAISCHEDIRGWLDPDWTFDTSTGKLSGRCLRRRAERIAVVVCRQAAWNLFARHHYLSGSLSRGCSCYLAVWEGKPVAFCAVVAHFGRGKRKRISRLVTLPDYQGLGIGTRLMERVCEYESARGFQLSITASHPAIIAYCRKSSRWQARPLCRQGSRKRHLAEGREVATSAGRAVLSFDFLTEENHANA